LVFFLPFLSYRHHLLQSFNRALLLAGPGAIIVCLLIATSAKIFLPFGWSWMYCMLFGAILCATDPVSVVSLMKSINCSTKLTMMVSGESLLNDGSAMILYLFFYNMINGTTYTASTFVGFCFEMLIVSPLIGFGVGLVASRIMKKINTPTNSHLDFQLICTFIAAYLSYYIAAALVDVSGVLSCCVAGFTVSLFAPVRVLHDEKFHKIWSLAEWACNTLIFLLAGIIGGGKSASVITGQKLGFLILMFLVLLVTRGIMTYSLLPFLNWFRGEKITFAETAFITFAGLRGSLAIALALEGADNANNNGNTEIAKDLFFFVTGLASFTLLVNGSTAGWVLFKLGLVDDPNAAPSKQLQQVLSRIRLFISSLLKEEIVKMNDELGNYDEKELTQLCEYLYHDPTNAADQRKMSTVGIMLSSFFNLNGSASTRSATAAGKDVSKKEEGIDLGKLGGGSDSGTERKERNSDYNDDNDDDIEQGKGTDSKIKIPNSRFSMVSSDWDKLGAASIRLSENFDNSLVHYIRSTFLNVIRSRYSEAVHSGKMPSTSTPTLLLYYSIDVALDHCHERLMDWEIIVKLLRPNSQFLYVCSLIDDTAYQCGYYPGLVSWGEVSYERVAIYVITNFIYAHQYAQQKLHQFLGGPINKHYDIAEMEKNKVLAESREFVS
jgi:NhaP-type Na+/H+ or K+/H+ antiporter